MNRPHLVSSAQFKARLANHVRHGGQAALPVKREPTFAWDRDRRAEKKARLARLMKGGPL